MRGDVTRSLLNLYLRAKEDTILWAFRRIDPRKFKIRQLSTFFNVHTFASRPVALEAFFGIKSLEHANIR
jgi:hypothetical protein